MAELHVAVTASKTTGTDTTIDLELAHLVVASRSPLPAGSLVTVNLRLSSAAPPLASLARVASVDPPSAPGEPSVMRLTLFDVWGKQAIDQLVQYIDEAAGGAAIAARFRNHVRVLVVDDNPTYREHAAKTMREAGFDVITATNGFEGLSATLKHQPSIVLTDINMHGMDGWQLLRMIRARSTLRRMPVIFLTDLSDEQQRLRGYELGVDDYVLKPFTEVELIARVERVLERARIAGEQSNDMRGALNKISVISLLSFAELERRTGILQLEREGERATVHLRDGSLIRIDLGATYDRLVGLERVFYILDWSDGSFELTSESVTAEDALNISTSYALLEHARRADEQHERR
jgi:DNA-binding response OmpR family regulator